MYWCPGRPAGRKPRGPVKQAWPRVCVSVSEARISAPTSANILGVLTWGYKLKNGPLRCDLFNIKTMLLHAHKVIHSVTSINPDFSGQAWPRPSRDDSKGPEWGLTATHERAAT